VVEGDGDQGDCKIGGRDEKEIAAACEQKTVSREYHKSYLNDVVSIICYSPFYHTIMLL